MPKVLIIAYLFPPISNSGTQRSVKFANHLASLGWDVTVLTGEIEANNSTAHPLLSEVNTSINVVRVPYWSKVISQRIASALPGDSEKLSSALEWRLKELWPVPDPFALWKKAAMEKGIQLVNEQGIDIIYASGTPWTSFLVANSIHEKTQKPYVLDYRDLWNDIEEGWNKSHGMKQKAIHFLNKRLEKKVTKKASKLISVTHSCVDKLVNSLNINDSKKCVCITNGYEPDEFSSENFQHDVRQPNSALKIGYTGVWKNGYSPISLYKAVEELLFAHPDLNIEIHTAGFSSENSSQFDIPEKNLNQHGRVDHAQALRIMASCDLLFLPVARGEYSFISLPGKFFEYVGSNKPIIAEVPEGSEVHNELQKVKGGQCINLDDIPSLKKAIIDVYQGDMSSFTPRDYEYEKRYHRANQAKQLAAVFDEILERKHYD